MEIWIISLTKIVDTFFEKKYILSKNYRDKSSAPWLKVLKDKIKKVWLILDAEK